MRGFIDKIEEDNKIYKLKYEIYENVGIIFLCKNNYRNFLLGQADIIKFQKGIIKVMKETNQDYTDEKWNLRGYKGLYDLYKKEIIKPKFCKNKVKPDH